MAWAGDIRMAYSSWDHLVPLGFHMGVLLHKEHKDFGHTEVLLLHKEHKVVDCLAKEVLEEVAWVAFVLAVVVVVQQADYLTYSLDMQEATPVAVMVLGYLPAQALH